MPITDLAGAVVDLTGWQVACQMRDRDGVQALASEQGKLFGSVGPAEIAKAATAMKLDVEKSEINLTGGVIRTTGEFKVAARLHSEVEVEFTVKVEALKA